MAKTADLVAPASVSERYCEIDALRGFALFGILLANLPPFLGLAFADTPERAMAIIGEMPQAVLAFIVNFLLDGKFYTVFSLLFGLGFALQLDRLEKRGAAGTRVFLRRMAILLVIGLVHLSFIWAGDILTIYALLGFTLPLFHRASGTMLLGLAALFIFVIPLVMTQFVLQGSGYWTAPLSSFGDMLWDNVGGPSEESYFTILDQLYWESFLARAAADWAYVFSDKLYTWRFSKVLGTMLLGMWAGRKLVRGELLENRKLLWTVLLAGLVLSLPVNYLYALQPPHTQTHWTSLVGTAPAGLAYAAAFLLAAPHMPRVTAALAPAGRMALTNYIAMSIVCVLVFYGGGLGLMGEVTLSQGYVFGIVLFLLLMIGSRKWLSLRRQGPLEWVWRRATYPAATARRPLHG